MPNIDDLNDAQIFARTVWGEARGEGRDGWIAVAWVIKNRADHPGWWGHTIREVCLKPWQFSSWNETDPNRQKMIDLPDTDPTLADIHVVCGDVLAGDISDPTGGATSYHTRDIDPSWDKKMVQTAAIGRHDFYKEAVS